MISSWPELRSVSHLSISHIPYCLGGNKESEWVEQKLMFVIPRFDHVHWTKLLHDLKFNKLTEIWSWVLTLILICDVDKYIMFVFFPVIPVCDLEHVCSCLFCTPDKLTMTLLSTHTIFYASTDLRANNNILPTHTALNQPVLMLPLCSTKNFVRDCLEKECCRLFEATHTRTHTRTKSYYSNQYHCRAVTSVLSG